MQFIVLDLKVVVCFTLNIWEHGDGQSSIIIFASSSSFDFMSSSKSLVHFLTTSLDKASGSFPGSTFYMTRQLDFEYLSKSKP